MRKTIAGNFATRSPTPLDHLTAQRYRTAGGSPASLAPAGSAALRVEEALRAAGYLPKDEHFAGEEQP